MTDAEKMLARAIAPTMVTYCPGSRIKRFATDMAGFEKYQPEKKLTGGQVKYLCQVAVRYRRQIPEDIVQLARRMLAELEAAHV